MKKIASVFIVFTLLFSLVACSSNTNNAGTSSAPQSSQPNSSQTVGSDDSSTDSESSAPEPEATEPSSKALVVYFSWSGNTERVAKSIQSQTGSDIFEIVPATPYSDDYDTVLNLAQAEQSEDARPAIAGSVENITDYDVIYVGYPNWWGDMPMILYTFFDSYDFSGKTVAPFCTSGGSGLSDTVNAIKELEPNAVVTEGLHVGSGASSEPEQAVSEWLSEIGFAK